MHRKLLYGDCIIVRRLYLNTLLYVRYILLYQYVNVSFVMELYVCILDVSNLGSYLSFLYYKYNPFLVTATTLCSSLGCEYECRSSLEGGICVCPEGKKVANDSRTCIGKIITHSWSQSKALHLCVELRVFLAKSCSCVKVLLYILTS